MVLDINGQRRLSPVLMAAVALHVQSLALIQIDSDGWEVKELRGPMDGHLTQKLETDCLHAIEKRGAVLGHKAGIEKFDGYTEAWTKKSLNVTSIKQILDWVYEDEANPNYDL